LQQPTTFELVVNLNIAKALGLLARGAGAGRCPLPGDREGLYSRGPAAFAHPEIYEFLTAERIRYTIWLPANSILRCRIGYLLKRLVGRPPYEVRRYYRGFSCQAQSWNKPRRVVAEVKGIRASCTRASASSRPTRRARQSASSPFTTSVGRRSNG
jgi:hypothetical protein